MLPAQPIGVTAEARQGFAQREQKAGHQHQIGMPIWSSAVPAARSGRAACHRLAVQRSRHHIEDRRFGEQVGGGEQFQRSGGAGGRALVGRSKVRCMAEVGRFRMK
jgi:hypothetical protein